MKRLVITRLRDDGKQTLGSAVLYEGQDKFFEFVTLEPPWRNNLKSVSCIPAGTYKVVPRHSPKYGDHYIVEGVDGRSYVLLHTGNYFHQTEGCILVGKSFADLNNDGIPDVTSSKITLQRLLQSAPKGFIMDIVGVV